MTSRQARRERRAAERKALKATRKSGLSCPPQPCAPAENTSTGFVPQNRAAINRANACHSTGPRSIEGKASSSRNSLKHGLASGELIIPGEDRTDFETLRDALLEEHQPANTTEEMLIQQMAQSYWLTQRALRLQNECFAEHGIDEKRLALFLRYQTSHERAFHKALNTLIRLQKERRREAIGFVSQQPAKTAHPSGFVSQNHTPSDEFSPSPGLECPDNDHSTSQAA